MMGKRLAVLLAVLCGLSAGVAARAQAPASSAAAAPVLIGGMTADELNAFFTGSFLFSPLDVAVIQRALRGQPTVSATLGRENMPAAALPVHRTIRISGVVYRAAEDWIVWMNGKKVTPDNLLPEIIDITVNDTSNVNLKWYDAGLNKVIAITLRPHQTYDITTGILLPGTK